MKFSPYVFVYGQNDAARVAASPQKHIIETPPYRSPDSPQIPVNKKQSRTPEAPPRPSRAASSVASNANAKM